ncbi:hypothetical protein [Alkalihalophilus marmarensis]|uniref:hypothetical protein n=1 Tax=Alkalihalophilus marmarensis TaxID=521377 RepID=UPI002DB650B2|nr:hypothetical protein [Alkalihalophilus marmarensis]MEC2073715.1 hypothetical protein [Alkalihalophilus marmarensis]
MVRTIYYYAVMFVTLVMMIGGGVAMAMNISDLVVPSPYYYSFQDFKMNQESMPDFDKTEEEIRAIYLEQKEEQMEMQRTQAMNQLIKNIAWVLIPLPFFILSRRQLKRE